MSVISVEALSRRPTGPRRRHHRQKPPISFSKISSVEGEHVSSMSIPSEHSSHSMSSYSHERRTPASNQLEFASFSNGAMDVTSIRSVASTYRTEPPRRSDSKNALSGASPAVAYLSETVARLSESVSILSDTVARLSDQTGAETTSNGRILVASPSVHIAKKGTRRHPPPSVMKVASSSLPSPITPTDTSDASIPSMTSSIPNSSSKTNIKSKGRRPIVIPEPFRIRESHRVSLAMNAPSIYSQVSQPDSSPTSSFVSDSSTIYLPPSPREVMADFADRGLHADIESFIDFEPSPPQHFNSQSSSSIISTTFSTSTRERANLISPISAGYRSPSQRELRRRRLQKVKGILGEEVPANLVVQRRHSANTPSRVGVYGPAGDVTAAPIRTTVTTRRRASVSLPMYSGAGVAYKAPESPPSRPSTSATLRKNSIKRRCAKGMGIDSRSYTFTDQRIQGSDSSNSQPRASVESPVENPPTYEVWKNASSLDSSTHLATFGASDIDVPFTQNPGETFVEDGQQGVLVRIERAQRWDDGGRQPDMYEVIEKLRELK